jgi:6-phosphogluconolactonase
MSQSARLFIGGYAKPGEKGLSVFDFNERTGEVTPVAMADVGPDPSYFCFSKKNNLVYIANEVMEFNGQAGGGLTTFKYSPEKNSFEKKNEMLIPYGGPCFISMSPDSGFLFLANYPKGSVAVVKLDSEGLPETITDTILYVKTNPGASHAHMIKGDPLGKMIYVSDLGQNMVFRYRLNTKEGSLLPVDTLHVPEGYGPRHFDFNKDGSKFYLINELGSKITVFELGEKPVLIQTVSTVRADFTGKNACADIHLSSDGKFLYGSNRGENTIVTFAIQSDGSLKLSGHVTCGGNWPRNFTIDPSGSYLLIGNEKSDSIALLKINASSGMPSFKGQKFKSGAPACLKFYL